MEKHRRLSDSEFVQKFEDCSLPVDYFSHEAHLRLAFLQIRDKGVEQAISAVSTDLKRFVKHVGAASKYHETLTIAAVRMVDNFMHRCPGCGFYELLDKYPGMKTDFRGLIETHYSFDIFSSKEARTTFILPDRQSFDAS